MGVGDPGRVIGADQFAAAFDVLLLHKIAKADDPPAVAVAGFPKRDIVARGPQLVAAGQSGEASPDHDDAHARRRHRARGGKAAHLMTQKQTGRRR